MRLIRPHNKYKYDEQQQIHEVLQDINSSNCTLTDAVLDKIKRSEVKCTMGHASSFPCEYCEACAVSIGNLNSSQEIKEIKKKYELRRQNLINTIEFLQESPGSTLSKARDSIKINELTSILNNLDKEEESELKNVNKKKQLCMPFSTMFGRLRTTDLIRYVANKIVTTPGEISKEERKGIKGKSNLLQQENFRFIDSVSAEYMHSFCLGVVKRLVLLTFNVGEKRETLSQRKLSDPEMFNKAVKSIQSVRECSRRFRNLDPSLLKAQEYRNIVLFLFAVVVKCIDENYPKERLIWLYTAYLVRACVIPNDEFELIKREDVKKISKKFYSLYEKVHGPKNCSYSIHVFAAHNLRIRGDNPVTYRSAFKFESFYSEMKNLFNPNSCNPSKQIIQNTLMKRLLEKHFCTKPVKYEKQKMTNKGLENNSLVYTFVDKNYKFYNIVKTNTDGSFQCSEQGKFPYDCTLTKNEINWSSVGVFKQGPSNSESKTIQKSEIKGKVIKVENLLITCPKNVLDEQ